MRWPPNQAWTSSTKKEGYRHFAVQSYGGKKDDRWVDLFAINNKDIVIRVMWTELKTYSKWTSGWLVLPKED
tara:strand:- start:44 stop:259 length:216 start_codon:yes stop_codon:yes gene_type:complete